MMNTTTTLDSLMPQQSGLHKGMNIALWLGCLIVLAISWVYCGIDPLTLVNKADNGYTYLFGHAVSESDKEAAMRQAKRMPQIFTEQEARQKVRVQMEKEGVNNPVAYATRVAARTKSDLAAMSDSKKAQIVNSEYRRLVDEKRGGYFPPEMNLSKLYAYTKSLLETIAMAIWGTLLAFIIAIPFSMLTARNTLQLFISGNGRWESRIRNMIWFCMRRILDFCRGFNEFVMALIFVAIIGLGPFAGVLALSIHTFGILGKVFSEGIEAIDNGQTEAVEASGAGPVQTIVYAVMPQMMPLIVSYSLLRFESNVRSASILGFVGAGGIGYLIFDKINGYMYREVCTIMLLVILTVTVIDYFCGILRKKFV